jgi:hypothetical protein
VDVCSAQPVAPDKSLIVPETQPVKILFVGLEDDSCRPPQNIWCSTAQVANLNVNIKPLPAVPTGDKSERAQTDANNKQQDAEAAKAFAAQKLKEVQAANAHPAGAETGEDGNAAHAQDDLKAKMRAFVEADNNAQQKQRESDEAKTKVQKLKAETPSKASASTAAFKAYGDCVVTMPSDQNLRQLVVAAKIQGAPLESEPHETDTPGPGPNFVMVDQNVRDALVPITASHGNYYADVGFLLAYVPDGERSIEAATRANIAGDNAIVITSQPKWVPSPAITIYPGGHRRTVYSGFEGKPRPWDLFGIQVALNPDVVKDPKLTQLFGGIVFEPITGLGASAGIIGLNGDFLKGDYVQGMSTTAARSDYVREHPMIRWYLGLTMSLELLNTSARRLQPTQGAPAD